MEHPRRIPGYLRAVEDPKLLDPTPPSHGGAGRAPTAPPGLHFQANLPTFRAVHTSETMELASGFRDHSLFYFLFKLKKKKRERKKKESQTQKSQRKHFASGINLIRNCLTPLSHAQSQMKDLFDFLALQTALIKLVPFSHLPFKCCLFVLGCSKLLTYFTVCPR